MNLLFVMPDMNIFVGLVVELTVYCVVCNFSLFSFAEAAIAGCWEEACWSTTLQ